MGCLASKNSDPSTRKIDQMMDADKAQDQSISKVLLLGPGESGKSTLFKQMISIYGKGFSEDDRKVYREAVHVDIITAVKKMSEYYDVFAENKELKNTISEAADNARGILCKTGELTPEHVQHIANFWTDPAVQEIFEMGNRFHLNESVRYFFEQAETVCQPDYLPSFMDIVHCRIRTTGIVELEFQVEKHIFKLFDMGGQRNERKKWIHCFENVTAVIFVAALNCYDQMLIEDERVNRMIEAINLFDDICNGRWFRKTAMILFLNKSDLFTAKLKKVPITTAFPDYTGKMDYQECADYIQRQFEGKNKHKKQVYTYFTCATATDNIRMVFNAIKDIIIRNGLKEIGLV